MTRTEALAESMFHFEYPDADPDELRRAYAHPAMAAFWETRAAHVIAFLANTVRDDEWMRLQGNPFQ